MVLRSKWYAMEAILSFTIQILEFCLSGIQLYLVLGCPVLGWLLNKFLVKYILKTNKKSNEIKIWIDILKLKKIEISS